jgi:hypothetical protein
LAIIEAVLFLAGEWVPSWLGLSVTFLVALLGVSGLGYWVLRGEALNRKGEDTGETSEATEQH